MKKIFTLFLFFAITFCVASAKTKETVACPTAAISYPESSFCSNSPTQFVMLTGTNTYNGGTFSSSPAGLSINASTGAILPSQSTSGTYTVTYTIPSGPGCSAVIATATVVVNEAPWGMISDHQTICSGYSGMIYFTGTANSTATYNVNGGPNQTITLNSAGNAMITTPPLTSNTTYNLVSVSTSSGCTSTLSESVIITVLPSPIMTAAPSSQTICSGSMTMINMTSSSPNTTFTWNCVQAGVIGGSAGTGNMIMQVLSTTGTSPGQAVYSITPTANGCPGTPYTVVVTVYPTPNVTPSTPGNTINSGDTTNIVLSSTIPGTTYTWTVSSNNVTGATSGSGNSIFQQLSTINSNQTGYVTYTITPSVNGCVGMSNIVQMTVNPNLGTNDFTKNSFIVSPNPVVDYISIKGDAILNHINVINQLGQNVLEKELNSNEAQLDLSALKTGIYFIKLESGNKKTTYKIIKQ
ncbi:T9SS type A sorting domain-containing protein [Flavobacterium sp. SM15]|uniref:PKD-like domain-containing protein n=1 Tax=Flavobacterium sp. SM15 TaxID=2908005 RepID=UPI001EDB0B8E|nr:PKD-like domain-containing protein [Flavobacterium sp. SM15]MCG2611132.1 T9SS type A sorting domain-containing protein [Flavobacterium sp. SM15]